MFLAVILGFWCMWIGDREVRFLLEAFFFTLIAIVANGFMNWGLPEPTNEWMVQWGVIWAWAALMFFIVDKWGSNLAVKLFFGLVAGFGYFWLEKNGLAMAQGWLA